MKETGLMFKAPLVRAILEGRKTQTRRVLRNQRAYDLDKCPLGQPGDRIYVRETWQIAGGNTGIWYAATDSQADDGNSPVSRWSPSIHMPKSAARIWLEITGVRVERLQEVSEADAVRDGGLHRLPATGRYVINQGDQYFGLATHDPRELFQEIWESTGGDWDANPWVWVIDFKTISTTGRPA